MWVLYIEPIFTYLLGRRGAKQYHKYVEQYVLSSKYDKTPPMVIIKHFGLKKYPVPINEYLRYLVVYFCFIRIFINFIVGIFTGFNYVFPAIMYFVNIIILAVYCVICTVNYFSFGRKLIIKKQKTHRSVKQGIKDDLEIIKSFFSKSSDWKIHIEKDIKKFIKKRKGRIYLPSDSVETFKAKLLARYSKYISCEICESDSKKVNFLIYEKDNGDIFKTIQILK